MNRSSSALSAAVRPRGPLAVLVVGAIVISFAGILVRPSEVGPAATGFYRFLFALPLLWLWTALRNRNNDAGPQEAGTFRLVLLTAALLLGEELRPRSWSGWLDLVGLALICRVAGQSMVAWALVHLPPSFGAVALLINPVSATILAWAILSEPAGMQQIVGGTIVLTGILLARSNSRTSEPAPAPVVNTAA